MQERVGGREYDELIDELIGALRERYGGGLILHWEDLNARNSYRLLGKYVSQVSLLALPPSAPPRKLHILRCVRLGQVVLHDDISGMTQLPSFKH